MTQVLTNYGEIALPLAVWLAADGYDFNPGQSKSISATSLLKPVRQILLQERLTDETRIQTDVSDRIASRLGHTIHDGIEKAWKGSYKESMKLLGYPQKLIDRVVINPTDPQPEDFPVYLEQRVSKEFMGYRISGKFDMILDGTIHDFKSTSAFSWKGNKDEDYAMQGSVYRWLNRDKVTQDRMYIHFIFTDWQKHEARRNPDYPQQRLATKTFDLLSLSQTEDWLRTKFKTLEQYALEDEDKLPQCTDKDLWRSDPVWKYFSDPLKADTPGARSTKNFDNPAEANAFKAEKGKGVVVHVPGQVKACSYCPVFNICTQKDLYDHA